jgi:putative Ca2+/H+ antiporter (TMEM165/GDT1 family)
MNAFWIAFIFMLAAEMGDKTQLVALAFATRYRTGTVLAGVFGATLFVHLFSVLLGEAAGLALPVFWINLLAGLSFIGFGVWTLRGDELGDEGRLKEGRFGPSVTVGVTFLLAELGDKTMLMTITVASQQQSFIAVWLGSTLGMVVADGLAIIVGKALGRRLPEKLIKYASAAVFIASGLFTLAESLKAR